MFLPLIAQQCSDSTGLFRMFEIVVSHPFHGINRTEKVSAERRTVNGERPLLLCLASLDRLLQKCAAAFTKTFKGFLLVGI
jgi:hypothetical protein